MKHRLLLLNLALIGALAYAAWQVRHAYLAAQARNTAQLNRRMPPVPPPPYTPPPTAAPVVPGGYANIAQQMLFDKSRNPTVVVEVQAPPPPPPPKPVPPLPLYHGQLNIGEGPLALLSENANAVHQAVKPGEQIGQFKLVDVNSEEIVFEWEGKAIRKKLGELEDHSAPAPAAQPTQQAMTRTDQPEAPVEKKPTGPGADVGGGFKACDVNDSTPGGAVVGSYRKVLTPSPFGNSCRWEPVNH